MDGWKLKEITISICACTRDKETRGEWKKKNIKGRKEGRGLHDEMQLKRKGTENEEGRRKVLHSIRERFADHILLRNIPRKGGLNMML